MEVRKSDKRKCGIYLIRNIINGKVYIGASVNIANRIYNHIGSLRSKDRKRENEHFINSWHKYGESNFTYVVIEECSKELLKSREFFWTIFYKSTDSKLGFNKRTDSENGMIVHPETSARITKNQIKRFENQEERDKQGVAFSRFWKNNPDKKAKMAQNVRLSKQQKHKFLKLDEQENILEEYDTIEILLKENPTYKWQNIYSVCNGYKKRIYGFKWRKVLKNE